MPERAAGGRALEVGCGTGGILPLLADNCPTHSAVVGVDLLELRLREADSLERLCCADGTALPFRSESFDVVAVFTVFSSIVDWRVAVALADEIGRVLTPGGVVIWYDLRRSNPRNPEVHAVTIGSIESLFPGWKIDLRSCTVLPPLVRRLGRLAGPSYAVLRHVPPLRTHLIGTITK